MRFGIDDEEAEAEADVEVEVEMEDVDVKQACSGRSAAAASAMAASYNDKIRPLLDAVDRLRQLNVSQEGIELPTIVVVGDQSSGKSSVLESLAGISLPRGQGICTRVPLVMRLQHGDDEPRLHIEYGGAGGRVVDIASEAEVADAIDAATAEIAGSGKGISDAPITLVVRKKGMPDLTLIDLPGITRVPVQGQPEDIYDQIARIIKAYIAPKESIILNVLSATVNFPSCESIRVSQQVDRSGERTLAVVTKADKAPEGLLEKVTVDDVHIGLGAAAVRGAPSALTDRQVNGGHPHAGWEADADTGVEHRPVPPRHRQADQRQAQPLQDSNEMDSPKENNPLSSDKNQTAELSLSGYVIPVIHEETDDSVTRQDNALAAIDECRFELVHKKPKKDMSSVIVPEDYICTQDDLALIRCIKNIPCGPKEVEVVYISPDKISRKHMECLFQHDQYLGDEVINSYLTLLMAQEHLKQRPGGTVLIEPTFTAEMFKLDAQTVDDNEKHVKPGVEQRVLSYISHDMVFIPINLPATHWYLAVVNARKREIQVLDSLGTTFGRTALKLALKGLQMQIDAVSRYNELIDHNWPDLHVDSWPFREIKLNDATQKDGYSCGLFMVTYAEYWTGDKLSNNFTQADMTHFRQKLAAILLSSDLNERKGQPIYKKEEDNMDGNPSSVKILEAFLTPNKRKRHPSPDNVIIKEGKADGCADHFLMSGLSTMDMPVTKADFIDVVCDYIMAIEDPTTLEAVWVRSFNPYKIELSVNKLQQILKMNQDMFIDCFNMGVRLLAHNEQKRLESVKGKVTKHYMDLRFFKMSGFRKEAKYHNDPSVKELAQTLDSWPQMNYNVTRCRFVLLPWKYGPVYTLFVIDHGNMAVTVIDFTRTPDWCKDLPIKRLNTSYLVLQTMEWWNSGLKMQHCMDDKTLRRNFLINLLTYEGNSCRFLIPKNVRRYLNLIEGKK
ncbi:hypothetical protein U9M48_030958 [Paspalum notatum var. saurae]|uniref:Ubiquitin-like protease family profile domain-containing protein n=1 Tax=Paspalum notatum var. saurae TaxID=547442 RepID=A0AAQ3X374_PASNO